ncbi:rhotekin isoform X2 [Gracilinanus agilis]|uniref:rhotekin isoform X2 n=1 Tax=Gracilinanus agilis TaxID=191870 RepID=UPI001CFE01C9|nr:rhotekin isoform X2 [Gracilinanus agilis]
MQDRLHIMEDLNMLYIRQMALSLEDTELQRKLDHEIRMREGACKLLAACSQREQALEATKSLLVCSSRILSYMGELQRRKEAQVLGRTARRPSETGPPDERSACRGTVCISDIRIPLMWKDTEYFKNKGDLHRWAVFLLLQLGGNIQDTEMVLVDRTLTDISFQSSLLFMEAGPDFELRLELYGACVEEEGALAGAPRRLASKLSNSLGRSSGRRVRASLESAGGSGSSSAGNPILLPTPAVGGPRYHLLAQTTLTLAAVQDGFRTHDLTLTSNEENPAWLPLYGSVCCRLAAQPLCMTQPVMSGTLRVQHQVGGQQSWGQVHGILKGTNLFCYRHPGEANTQEDPLFTIAINKETRVRAGEKDQSLGGPLTLSISNRYGGDEVTHTLQMESRGALQRWMEALWQLFFDMSQWKQCCDELMKIEVPSPRKPPPALAKQGSLYHEMAIDPLDDIAAVTDILAKQEGPPLDVPPPWLALFTEKLPSSKHPIHAPRSPSPPRACPGSRATPWGRPRTLSLDAAPRGRPPLPPRSSSSSSSGSGSPAPRQRSPPARGFRAKARPWLQSPV